MARLSQNIYAPLPQSLSDSDSEKEIESGSSSYGNRKKLSSKLPNCDKLKDSYPEAIKNHLPRVKSVTPHLSPLRKFALVVTILLCFLPIVLFIWVLPCSELNSCVAKEVTWMNRIANVELKGRPNLIRGVFNNQLNLAVAYKGSQYSNDHLNHGVVSLLGSSGAIAWDYCQEIVPRFLNCSLIDVNGNGYKDCLLLDEKGLKVLGTISGEIIWYVHSHEEGKTIVDLEFPIIIPDYNNDGINELIMIYKHESLLLVCGKTGRALKIFPVPCSIIGNLKLRDQILLFSCLNTTDVYQVPILELKKTYENDVHLAVNKFNESLKQEKPVEESRRKIIVNIEGSYPSTSANITLFDVILNNNIRTWKFDNAFVTEALEFSVQLPDANSDFPKGFVSGFIFKLWTWPSFSPKGNQNVQSSAQLVNTTYLTNNILEQVVLIAYNYTNSFNVFNISVQDITQLCTIQKDVGAICQPDLENLSESIVLGDLNTDGDPELIMYSSTFVAEDDDSQYKKNWQLVSSINVMNLKQELQRVLSFH